MIATKENAKKRLMYIQKEDYNFLTYNILIILKFFNAKSEETKFKDFRKIAYLVDFVNLNAHFSKYDQNELGKIYSQAQLKKKLISHLLIILKNRELIGISINHKHQSFDIWIKENNIPADFFNRDLFKDEIKNLKILHQSISRLKAINVKTMVDVIFTKNNVITWEV